MKLTQADLKQLPSLRDDGWLRMQSHPDYPLLIWNYTEKTQYERNWTKLTRQARGLITTDDLRTVVARPFPKFHNVEEHEAEDMDDLPALADAKVVDKLDGSLGISYWWDDKVHLATRGSFTSDQALAGTQMLREDPMWSDIDFSGDYTYLFEIIYPENRIVVDYKGFRGLYLLGVLNRYGGPELDVTKLKHLRTAQKFTHKQMDRVRQSKSSNREGFVLVWPTGLRAKIKLDEYKRLHRLVTGISSRSIWDLLRNKESFDELLHKVPDEFYEWVRETKAGLEKKYRQVEAEALAVHAKIKDLPTRKDQALAIQQEPPHIKGVVFAMLDGKPWDHIIWKHLRPKYEQPFKEEV